MNKKKIPQNGPTILVGNHPNMFIDALILIAICDRPVRFLIAGVSYRKLFIRFFADCIGAIPVERQQDNKIKGQGEIVSIDHTFHKLKGQNTKFKEFFQPGDQISIKNLGKEFQICEIISDEEMTFKKPKEEEQVEHQPFDLLKSEYYRYPKLEQSQVFENVWKRLNDGELICLFPEGGSHDSPKLLPLKAGCCIMGLGGNLKYNLKTQVIAVGLNYYSPHKFRSKMIIEFGDPYIIPQEAQDLYLESKSSGIKIVIDEIEKRMKDVTLTADTREEIQRTYTARSLYISNEGKFSTEDKLKIYRKLQQSSKKLRQFVKYKQLKPEFLQLQKNIVKYQKKLNHYNLIDEYLIKKEYQLQDNKWLLFINILTLFIGCLLIFPLAIIQIIPYVLISYTVDKERENNVDIQRQLKGLDVIATFLVINSLKFHFFYLVTLIISLALTLGLAYDVNIDIIIIYCVMLFFIYPIYSYISIQIFDHVYLSFKKLKLFYRRYAYKEAFQQLLEERGVLVKELQENVRKYWPEILNQEEMEYFRIDSNYTELNQLL